MSRSLEIDPSWRYYSAEANRLMNVCETRPFKPYLSLTLPARDAEGRALKINVRRIVFTTVSHDQGWSSYPHLYGTYKESYSMNDVHVMRLSGNDRVPLALIHNNVHGSGNFKLHVTCWDFRDDSEELTSWLAAVQSGDCIQIVPKVYFLKWLTSCKKLPSNFGRR
jgi:hypothetical protein